MNWDGPVYMVMIWITRLIQFLTGMGCFLFITVFTLALETTQLPIRWVPTALSLGVKKSTGAYDLLSVQCLGLEYIGALHSFPIHHGRR